MRAFVFALILSGGAARADIPAGNWEMTLTTSIEGMPGAMAPVTQVRCLTREDAQDPSRLVGSAPGCEFSNKQDTGSEISFDVVCSGQVSMGGRGVMRYTAQSVEGSLDLTANASGQRIVTRSQLSGRRLGECKP
ncbi:hypothetical protein AYO46_10565 [Betaproteobacteria bacterium SCGC AG-212-J23]|nr:hypothetical protein AYO46_10565 [Betaproteobacteria bacterium SCGC AG-212-J23]